MTNRNLRREGKLEELVTLDMTTPEDMQKLKVANTRGPDYHRTLEVLRDAGITDRSIALSWRPPTRNADRIDGYKVMMVGSTGLVKVVYEGRATSCTVAGLLPATDYVLSVKANYEDGSYVRSEPASFTTKTL